MKDWTKIVKPHHSLSPPEEVKYVSFGWGDLEFYRNTPEWKDLKLKTAFKSLFLKTPAAIHVRFLTTYSFGGDSRAIAVTQSQYEMLSSYIKNSFKFATSGNTQPVKDLHYTRDDVFYHARGSLNLFKTCNTWVNSGLKNSDLKASLWTPFVEGIFLRYPKDRNEEPAAAVNLNLIGLKMKKIPGSAVDQIILSILGLFYNPLRDDSALFFLTSRDNKIQLLCFLPEKRTKIFLNIT
ncbi:DUF2459 domain-containing protein [Antarcticibacterium sp. 1MA-6-2]|uniref:DUF2459 domain-containing protein n=1 Tax=Antarcticibacterium sp. 1MA-6-2 TaxID=2908210 RepID=UPI001F1A8985|nr:DUF2459 domain-containing protein [Antarcticibacterium sp. 1MA-6-2]UJH92382.1 DUF2459 domain-containing protein [Antarcticibacterium sp. 1MA-6-2]